MTVSARLPSRILARARRLAVWIFGLTIIRRRISSRKEGSPLFDPPSLLRSVQLLSTLGAPRGRSRVFARTLVRNPTVVIRAVHLLSPSFCTVRRAGLSVDRHFPQVGTVKKRGERPFPERATIGGPRLTLATQTDVLAAS